MTLYSLLIDLHSWRGKNGTFAKQRAADHLQDTGSGSSLKHGPEPRIDSDPRAKAAHAHADHSPDQAPPHLTPEDNADADSNAHLDPHGYAYQLIVETGLLSWCNSGARHLRIGSRQRVFSGNLLRSHPKVPGTSTNRFSAAPPLEQWATLLPNKVPEAERSKS